MGYGRLYIKTPDANNPDLLSLLDQKGYNVNKDKTRFGRTKQVMQGIFSGLGIFGLLVVVMALMLFSFYLQLVIARSKESLQLLLLIGYSPLWLSKNVSRRFIPIYVLIVLTALLLTQLMQWAFHHFVMYDREELNTVVHWAVIALAVTLIVLSAITNYRLVKKLLYRLF
jgi:cell division protein FtsX